MKKRVTYKSRQRTRIKLRTVFVICSVVSTLAIAGVLFIFQFFENETSMANSDPMVISNIEVFQDTIPVLKGTSMQVTLGIKIQTKGRAQHLNFAGVELSARGTSRPFETYASNARLWSTGNNDFFIPAQQVGATLSLIPEENFRLDGKQKLLEGDNYFWVTFDVNQVAGSKPTQIDAECIAIQIGTLTHDPAVSAPPGARRILNNNPYYSVGNGDISSLDSWNSTRDGSGKRPTNFNQVNATFHIQSGHILRNDVNACLTYLVIERNGVLLSASSIKSDCVEIHGGGTLVQEKAFLDITSIEVLKLSNGGNYIHQNKGALPGKIKMLDAYSNVVLNNYGPETFIEHLEWGNLVIDSKTSTNTEFANCFKTVRGNLEIRATGKESFLYSTSDDTINIEGDLVINGGRLILSPKNSMQLNVNREFEIKSGWFSDAIPGKVAKGHVEFNPGSKMYIKGGGFSMTAKRSSIKFHEEFVTWLQETAEMNYPDVVIMPGCTLKLAGSTTGMIAENRTFTVSSTAMLDCGTSTIAGKGAFRLEQHATLATAHAEGIHSDTDAGSIRTKVRYYSSSADYIFTGSSSPQSTGIFNTLPQSNTVNQMTINKTNPAAILILQQDLTITGRLIKERGSINKNTHKLESGDQATVMSTP